MLHPFLPRTRAVVTCLFALAVLVLQTHAAPPPPPPPGPAPKAPGDGNANANSNARSWTGTWNNQKFKTTGPLTCTVIGEQNGQWIAKFSGTGMGRPFNFTALITVKDNNAAKTLQGTTRVEGDSYQWTGALNGLTMTGNFRSGSGNNGSFTLSQGKRVPGRGDAL